MLKSYKFGWLVGFGVSAFVAGSMVFCSHALAEGSWNKAGKEVKEAAGAVVDATADTSKETWDATKDGASDAYDATAEKSGEIWDATKDTSEDVWGTIKVESVEAWEKTRDGSKSIYEKAKEKIHEATAPDPGEGVPDPAE